MSRRGRPRGAAALTAIAGSHLGADQLRLVENLALMLRQHMVTRRSITELRGLGKDVWQGIDAQEYVNQERDAWDG